MRVESSGEAAGTTVPPGARHALAREGGALHRERRASPAAITASAPSAGQLLVARGHIWPGAIAQKAGKGGERAMGASGWRPHGSAAARPSGQRIK